MGMMSMYPMDQYILRFNRLRELQKFCTQQMDPVRHTTETADKSFTTVIEVGRHPGLLLQTSCLELILWREGWHQYSSIPQEPSPITTIQKQRMASSLSTCGCIPSVSMDLFKISLSCSPFTEGKHDFFSDLPTCLQNQEPLNVRLICNNWGKRGIEYLYLSPWLWAPSSPLHSAAKQHFPSLPFATDACTAALLALHFPHQI